RRAHRQHSNLDLDRIEAAGGKNGFAGHGLLYIRFGVAGNLQITPASPQKCAKPVRARLRLFPSRSRWMPLAATILPIGVSFTPAARPAAAIDRRSLGAA